MPAHDKHLIEIVADQTQQQRLDPNAQQKCVQQAPDTAGIENPASDPPQALGGSAGQGGRDHKPRDDEKRSTPR